MPIASVNGLDINYETFGDDGPWIALITGGRRGYQELIPLAGKIAAEGFRVLLHDRRNTGASGISITAEDVEEVVWADDLRGLLGQLDALPAFIGGSSSGARTAIFYCLRHAETMQGLLLLRVKGLLGVSIKSRSPVPFHSTIHGLHLGFESGPVQLVQIFHVLPFFHFPIIA